MELPPNKEAAHKVDSGEESSPAASARIQTHWEAGIACWLERRAQDQKVASSNPDTADSKSDENTPPIKSTLKSHKTNPPLSD